MNGIHTPVLLKESSDFLITDTGGNYFDATMGFGGHSSEFLSKLDTQAMLIASDVDEAAFNSSQKKFSADSRVRLYRFNFSQIDIMAKLEGIEGFTGVFADLGVSSFQLDEPEAGFSFKHNAKLDLRLDKTLPLNAGMALNTLSEKELSDIFFQFGEEKNARKIARRIVENRVDGKEWYSADLESIITRMVPPNYVRKTMTRVFQALRIYINSEMEILEVFLKKAIDLLVPGGRIVVLTYHSLEDRIVKEIFRKEEKPCTCPPEFPVCVCGKKPRLKILTRKAVSPSDEEIQANFRARSAQLRAAEKL
ncbi:MAG: 16S rRNA (cytosine(1402)-N(4))-methyltransferase RsmH [Ignavibacteria bacterium]|nr:16S rRNA (cytosine(1402)-N(4))-methyltransferase RsmH [Ignavibacteria bacterium]